jgi:hypothetical protein
MTPRPNKSLEPTADRRVIYAWRLQNLTLKWSLVRSAVAQLGLVRSMRVALFLLLVSGAVAAAADDAIRLPPEVLSGKWHMLDKRPKARTVASWWTLEVPAAEFRKIQRHYQPQDFEMWANRLRQLRKGMTEKQVEQILRPKMMGGQITAGGMYWDTVLLNDAYFADIYVDQYSKRMIATTRPLAMCYEITPTQKKFPKDLTNRSSQP